MSLKDKTEAEIRQAVANATSFQGALRLLLGVDKSFNGAQNRWLRDKIDLYNIDISHMTHTNLGKHFPNPKLDDEEYLSDVFSLNSKHKYADRRNIILKRNLLPYKCQVCGNEGEWNGKPLTLTLDHKNGNHLDNRLDNLRFICPNCDSQSSTFGSRNKVRYKAKVTPDKKYALCLDCGKKINYRQKRCGECAAKHKAKGVPTKEELLILLNKFTSFTDIGKLYKVSDNAVRKWCKKYGLPYKSKDVKNLLRMQV